MTVRRAGDAIFLEGVCAVEDAEILLRTDLVKRTHLLPTMCTTRTVADARQGTPMTDREKILIALREKPLKAFEIMKRVNIKHQDCQSLF